MKRLISAALMLTGGLAATVSMAWAQNPPAPTEDRVKFPDGYKDWPMLYVFDRPDTKQVRTVYANSLASTVSIESNNIFPYGSVLVMEVQRALQDAAGVVIPDANGRYQVDPAAVPNIFVMRKERGFGEAYEQNRTGEWEYVGYRPDKTYQTTPQNSFSCAACHTQMGAQRDWVARAGLKHYKGSGAVPGGVMTAYQFLPGVIRVKAGETVTIYNNDPVDHTIADDFQPGLDSGRLKSGQSYTIKFTVPGELNYHCNIHPAMKGKVIVEP